MVSPRRPLRLPAVSVFGVPMPNPSTPRARPVMRSMGFLKPHNVGPGWLKQGKPPQADLRGILGLPFANVLPAHGTPVLGSARDLFRPAIDRAAPPMP